MESRHNQSLAYTGYQTAGLSSTVSGRLLASENKSISIYQTCIVMNVSWTCLQTKTNEPSQKYQRSCQNSSAQLSQMIRICIVPIFWHTAKRTATTTLWRGIGTELTIVNLSLLVKINGASIRKMQTLPWICSRSLFLVSLKLAVVSSWERKCHFGLKLENAINSTTRLPLSPNNSCENCKSNSHQQSFSHIVTHC